MSQFITPELQEAQDEAIANDPLSVMYSGRTENTLSTADRMARDAFILEYCKDFNAKNAMMRIGVVNPKTAATKGSIWLREAYCQQRIRELTRELKPTDIVQRNDVMAGLLKEANNETNDGNVRVAAWVQLGKMVGAIEQKSQATDNSTPTNIMLIPVANMEAWAAQAGNMQAKLKEKAAMRDLMPMPRVQTLELEQ